MTIPTCFFVAVLLLGTQESAKKDQPAPKKLPDGVYRVLRSGLQEGDVLPVQAGEVVVVDRHRYLKNDEPPQFLVVRAAPDVPLELAAEPKADKEGNETVRILVKLKPQAARALERLTRERLGKQVAILIGGEVVTVHKIRGVIVNGEAQITSCAPGGAAYLLKQLQERDKKK